MNNKRFFVMGIVALLLASLVVVGCGSSGTANASASDSAEPAKKDGDKKKKGEDDKKKEEAVPVEVVALEQGPIEAVLRFSSNLETESQVKVVSQAKRQVVELRVEEGHRVRKGQVLLRLEDAEQRSALAKVQSQLAKAEREYENNQRLYKQQLISQEAYNNANYELEQLQIALSDARRELSYTEVRAPIAGTVTTRMINLGDQVQIGQELFEIVDFDSMVARVFVPEKHLGALRPGQHARLSAQAAGRRDYTAKVTRIAPTVDPKSGTIKVTLKVGNQPGLLPGMYVDVDLVTATSTDAVLVPKRAIVYDNDQMFVYRLKGENRVERVFFEPRLTDKHFVQPADGLSHGDQVVVAGQAGLKDGALVSLPGEEEPTDQTSLAHGNGDEADAGASL